MAALPEGWGAHLDAEGRTFYYNASTGESSWEVPAAAPAPAPLPPAPAPDALLPDWAEHVDPASGRSFYYNATSGETSWDRPAAAAPSWGPPAAAAATPADGWTLGNTFTGWTHDEYCVLNSAANGQYQRVTLDMQTHNSVQRVVDLLKGGERNFSGFDPNECGYCIVYSGSKKKYFMLWRTDKEFNALYDLKIPNVMWEDTRFKTLGGPGCEQTFAGKCHCLDTTQFTSINASVKALNDLSRPPDHYTATIQGAQEMGFAVCFDSSYHQWCLLYAKGKKDESYNLLGLGQDQAAG